MVSVGSDMVTRMAALEGVRVADLSGAIGADATKLLGDLGADVVTVEPPGGDRLRVTPPFRDGTGPPDSTAPRSTPSCTPGPRGNPTLSEWSGPWTRRRLDMYSVKAKVRTLWTRL